MPNELRDQPIKEIRRRPTICYFVGIVLVAYLVVAVLLIVAVHVNFFRALANFQLLRTHVICGGFGMLGAAMATTRKFYRILITETTNLAIGSSTPKAIWDFGWVFYYVTRPVLGGILGALSFTLSFVGFNILASSDVDISSEGRFLLFGVAFISGFSVSQMLDRLNGMAKQLFKETPEKEGM